MITKKLLVSFLITVFSLHSSTAQAITIKAPTTQNKNTENILDYDAYNNEIKQIIIEQEKRNPSQSPFIKKEDSEIDIVPGVVSKSILQYQQEILNAIKTNTSTQSTLLKASSTLIDTIRAAYATQPFTTNSVMALFNNTNYLRLRQEAEDKKKSDLKNAEDKKDTEIQKASRRLGTLRVKIKQQFENRRKEVTQGLTNLKNSLQQKVVLAKKTIQNNKDRISRLKQLLKDKLDTFKYLSQKTSTHKKDYKRYEDKYKSAKKKYKKYKKKYKKKKKSKYKKRYKKYKKKYKTYKRRYNTHKDRYNKYKKQRNQTDADYLKLQVELRKLEIKTGSLGKELIKNESNLIVATSNLIKDQNKPALEDDLEYQKVTAKEGIDYEASVKVINEKYTKEVSVSTELYNRGIQRAEAYQEAINNPQVITAYRVEETRAVGQDRLKYELEVQRQVEEAIQKEKALALKRVESRYQVTREMASVVFAGMLKVPQQLVNTIKSKLKEAKKGLDRIKHKTKDLKEAYQENKKYEKKMKEYKKKYEKYSKKVRKYSGKKDKRSRKKYKKYNNKKSSAKKKYLKYKKKFEKYGQLKKAYKSGYKQADEIKDSYEDQYNYLLSVERQIQANYQRNYSQASRLRKELFSRAEQERSFSLNQMEVGSPFDYDLIGNRDNSDVKNYQEVLIGNMSEDATNKGMSDYLNSLDTDFSSGVDALADIKGNLKDFRSKAKKAYAKRLKEIAKLQAEQERQRQAYLAAQRRQAYLAEQKKIEVRGSQEQNANKTSYYSSNPFLNYLYQKGTAKPTAIALATGLATTLPVSAKFKYNTETNTNSEKGWFEKIKEKIGKGIKKWYNIKDYNQMSMLDKVNIKMDIGGDILSVGALSSYLAAPVTSGASVVVGGVLDITGAILDAGSMIMYGIKGDWKNSGRKAISIIPGIGNLLANSKKLVFGGKAGIKVLGETSAMAKIREKYAPFAAVANGSDWLPGGFKRVTDASLKNWGMDMGVIKALSGAKGSVYLNKQTKEVVTAFAGTRTGTAKHFFVDMRDNLLQGIGIIPKNYKELDKLGGSIGSIFGGFKKSITGQSKGGVPASIVGAILNADTILFNPAGVHKNLIKRFNLDKTTDFDKLKTFVNQGDILNTIQSSMGSLLSRIMPSHVGDSIKVGNKTGVEREVYTFGGFVGKVLAGFYEHGIKRFIK